MSDYRIYLKPIFHCDAKPFALGPGIDLEPQRHNFALPIPTCWYLKTLKIAFPPTPNLKFALPTTPTPNASQWNIGYVESPMQNLRVGNVHFFFWVLISFVFGSHRKPRFRWNMGFILPRISCTLAVPTYILLLPCGSLKTMIPKGRNKQDRTSGILSSMLAYGVQTTRFSMILYDFP